MQVPVWLMVMSSATTGMVSMLLLNITWFRQNMKELRQEINARFDKLEAKVDRLIEVSIPGKTPSTH